MTIANKKQILELIKQGAIFYVSHSGGKDSQAMYAELFPIVPIDQIVVVHADLGEIEWTGVQDHIKENIHVDHEMNVVSANKTLFDMIRHRSAKRPDVPSFPSSAHRQCTSDLKRNPIYKFIRNDMKKRGSLLAVNCMGLRASESSARAKKETFKINNTLSKAGRTVHEYLPIHDFTEEEVFASIKGVGQKAFWAYEAGNKRLSCVFCIMGCDNDLKNGAKHRPGLYQKILELEKETGWTMFHGKSLQDRVEG